MTLPLRFVHLMRTIGASILLRAVVLFCCFFVLAQCEVKLAYVLDNDKINVETEPCSPTSTVITHEFEPPVDDITYKDAAVDDRTGHIYLIGLKAPYIYVLRIEINDNFTTRTYTARNKGNVASTGLAISKKDNLLFYGFYEHILSLPLNFTDGFEYPDLAGTVPLVDYVTIPSDADKNHTEFLHIRGLDVDAKYNLLYALNGEGRLYRGEISAQITFENLYEDQFRTRLNGAGMKADTDGECVFGMRTNDETLGDNVFFIHVWGKQNANESAVADEVLLHVAPDMKNHFAYYTSTEKKIQRMVLDGDNIPHRSSKELCRNVMTTGQPSVITTWISSNTGPSPVEALSKCSDPQIPGTWCIDGVWVYVNGVPLYEVLKVPSQIDVVGDFYATSNGTIVVNEGGLLSISGCSSFDGTLVLVLDTIPKYQGFVKDVANYTCRIANSTFNSEGQDCKYSGEPIYTPTKMSVLVRQEKCGNVNSSLKMWHFVAIGIAGSIIFGGIAAMITSAFLRKLSFDRTMAQIKKQNQLYAL